MSEVGRALSLMDQLCRLLAAPPATAAAVQRLLKLAEGLQEMALGPSDLDSDSAARDLASKLAALGDSLSRLTGHMMRPGGRTDESAAASLPLPLLGDLCNTVSIASQACSRLAHVLGARLQRGDAYRLCAGLSFVLQVGTVLLRRCLQTLLSSASRQVPLLWLLTAVKQLKAVHSGMRLAAEHSEELAGALARTARRPSTALPWLATVADVLVVAVDSGVELGYQACMELPGVCALLFNRAWSGEHAAALAAAPAVQAALMGLLLGHVLPSTADLLEVASDSSSSGGAIAGTSGLQACGREAVCGLQSAIWGIAGNQLGKTDTAQLLRCVRRLGAAAVVQQAGRIARALPLQQHEHPDAAAMPFLAHLRQAHREAAKLVACVCMAAGEVLAAQPGAAEAAAAPGRVPGSSCAASVEAERGEVRRAMLELAPHAAAVVQALAVDSRCTVDTLCDVVESYSIFFQYCRKLGRSLSLASDSQEERHEAAEVAAVWAAALHACLQLLAFGLPRCEGWQQRPGYEVACSLPATLCMLWVDGTAVLLDAARCLVRQPPPREPPELLESMWALHSAGCRTLHWLAQQQQQAALVHGLHDTVPLLLGGLHNLLMIAIAAIPPAGGRDTAAHSTIAVKRAICAAHWAVLREPHLGAGAGGGPNEHCLRGLLLVIGALPEVADEPLAALLATVLEPAHSAVERDRDKMAKLLLFTLTHMAWNHVEYVRPMPLPLLAGLAAGGLLGRLAEDFDHPLAGERGTCCAALLEALCEAAGKLGTELEQQQQQDKEQQEQEQQQLQQDLRHSAAELQAVVDGIPLQQLGCPASEPGEAASFAAAITGAALPARRVAALLLQHCARPEQVAADRMAVAQAAAARSCANLRCANVELEGGPGAGKGRGCKRCSGCRAVFYCGTECSHADWRAIHRRTCAQLAAARQPSAAR